MPDAKKRKKWTFSAGYTLKSFQERLREVGLPSSTSAIKYWEKKRWITIRRTPGGWRAFVSKDEMDGLIRGLLKKKGVKKAPHEVDPDFSVVGANLRL